MLGTMQFAPVRSVGGAARNAIWTSRLEETLDLFLPPARLVKATVGTGSLVLNALEQAR